MKPYTIESYQLLHEGTLALSEVEANGIHVDVPYIKDTIKTTRERVARLERQLENTDIGKLWRKTYGGKTNFHSSDQLGMILFEKMGFTPPEDGTKGGSYKTDVEALSDIDHPFIPRYIRMKKLKKSVQTNLLGILREVDHNDLVHPFFHLFSTQTYRSSSEAINFQNQPIRDEMIMQLIRRAFIPRPGRQLVECDFSGIEVRVATCYHKDPTMIKYIEDTTTDMHRDMAMECYFLAQAEVTKQIRYCAKNQFVFPQFYGDWYIDCARSLWKSIDKMKLVTESGLPLLQHLKAQGINSLGALDPKSPALPGTMERHIQQVEKRFWEKRFPVYKQWKLNWYEDYRKNGYFKTLTGFICQGYMKRNEAINYGVQGSAFHCLLWTLIRLVNVELRRRKMKSLVVGQIHDSIVADVVASEMQEFLHIVYTIVTKRLMEHWKWLIVPMDIEAEAAPIDGPWSAKEKIAIA